MEKIRTALEGCYVLTPAWHSALNTLERTDKRILLISGASGSGRSLLAEMAACLLCRRGRLKRTQPLVLNASMLRDSDGVGKLKAAASQARREGRLLVIEEGELLSVFPEEKAPPLLKLLQHSELNVALLVYDKMYAALQPVLAGIMPSAEVLTIPPMRSDMLPELLRKLAEKRWYSLSVQAVQAVLQHAGSMQHCTMGDAARLLRLVLHAQRDRCIHQGIPEGSRESRTIIAADVHAVWDNAFSGEAADDSLQLS